MVAGSVIALDWNWAVVMAAVKVGETDTTTVGSSALHQAASLDDLKVAGLVVPTGGMKVACSVYSSVALLVVVRVYE
jgi:hypothetical protein